MAVGNTFGATALASYGGFWLSFAIILTPGGFEIVQETGADFDTAFGFFLAGWFIFTTILLLCTLRSTIAFFLLFFFLDLAFLMLMVGYLYPTSSSHTALIKAGGYFGESSAARRHPLVDHLQAYSPPLWLGIMPLPAWQTAGESTRLPPIVADQPATRSS
jgi:succinate-acetate transporter protein